jgi:hypothetical protein
LAQNWFKHQETKFALRTTQNKVEQRSRQNIVDSLPWLPQWDLAKSYDLEGGKTLVLMPLWRYKNVSYNPNYGFMRRLKLIVSAQNEIEYGAITEVISLSKQDLQTLQDDIIYQACIGALSGNYFIYDIALDNPIFTRKAEERTESTGECMIVGQSDTGNNCITYMICTNDFIDFFFDLSVSVGPCPRSVEEPPSSGGNGGGLPMPNFPTPPINNIPMPGTGGEPSTGGGGSGSGNGNIGGIYPGSTFPGGLADPRNPIYSTPPAQNPQIDYGDNTSPNLPHQPSALLKSITKQKPDGSYDFGNLSNEAIRKLDETIQAMDSKSGVAKLLIQELVTHKISWKEGVTGAETGSYTPATKTITIRQDAENFYFEKMGGVMEEMIHALQHKKYGANFTNIPKSNIEFEAKLIKEMIIHNILVSDGQYDWLNKHKFSANSIFPEADKNQRLKDYVENITNKGTSLPKSTTDLSTSTETYWTVLVLFREKWAEWYGANHPYAVQHSQQKPDVLLFLSNQCNCSQRLIN